MRILDQSSPNFGPRRGGVRPDMVIVHHTAMASAEVALARLCDPAAEVSAHYLVGEDGRIWRLVAEEARAWHAGTAAWGGVRDVNSHSVGIELANTAGPASPPYPEPQMAALEALLDAVSGRWGIAPERVLAHSDVAPGRKSDPGSKFDWRRLAVGGRGVWPDRVPAARPGADFAREAARIGYVAPDGDPGALLQAFRLRFRPWASSPGPDAEDVAVAAAVAAAWPCVDPEVLPT